MGKHLKDIIIYTNPPHKGGFFDFMGIYSKNILIMGQRLIITEEERIRIEGMYEQKKGSTPWEPRGDELHLIMAALKNGNIDARAVAGIPGFIIKDNGSKWSAAYNDTYFQAWKRELKK